MQLQASARCWEQRPGGVDAPERSDKRGCMPDVLTREQRHLNMSRIRAKDTKPEMLLRRGLHARGFRYQLHRRELAGCPDLVFPRYRTVIFVHGCFWHGHECHLFKMPNTRREFWLEKIFGNVGRDRKV